MTTPVAKEAFIFAGEPSGDLLGAHLVCALLAEEPSLHFFGVGGMKLQEAGLELLLPMEQFQLFGFTAVLTSFRKIYRQFQTLLAHILKRNPPLCILIDYPGLNLRLAKALRKRGYKGKIAYYISPKVWAWGEGRIKTLRSTLDLLLCIFPFEPPFFAPHNVPARYVGNPLAQSLALSPHDPSWRDAAGFRPSSPICSLFPGSRKSEIERILLPQLKTAALLKEAMPELQFGLSIASDNLLPQIRSALSRTSPLLQGSLHLVHTADTRHLMRASKAALAKCGTVNLELALLNIPSVVVYRLSTVNALLARYLFRINLPHYSLPNIIAGSTLFPELIHQNFHPRVAAKALLPLLHESRERDLACAGCRHVQQLLHSEFSPSQAAALAILELL